MTKQLMTLSNGKLVLVLEGGYDLPSICDASENCVGALLGDEIKGLKEEELCRRPHQTAIQAIENTIKYQGIVFIPIREPAIVITAFLCLSHVIRNVNILNNILYCMH